MKEKDYFVLVYRILTYLYESLKDGKPPETTSISSAVFGIPDSYHKYIFKNLCKEGYIEEVATVSMRDMPKGLKPDTKINIKPKGIEFLQYDPLMIKVKEIWEKNILLDLKNYEENIHKL